jgi:hypothetical protein
MSVAIFDAQCRLALSAVSIFTVTQKARSPMNALTLA